VRVLWVRLETKNGRIRILDLPPETREELMRKFAGKQFIMREEKGVFVVELDEDEE
jgi:hypothetical protein